MGDTSEEQIFIKKKKRKRKYDDRKIINHIMSVRYILLTKIIILT